MGLVKQLYKGALWYWNGNRALHDEPAAPTLDDDWEVLEEASEPGEESQSEEKFTVTQRKVALGLYSLISKSDLNNFLLANQDSLACFWSDKSNDPFHGSIKTFGTSSYPPGWFKLSYLQKVIPNFFPQLGSILYPELARLRALDLEDPYSRRAELQSPLLQGLFVCRSFLHYIFTEICKNPFTDLVITFPMEILQDMGRTTIVYDNRKFVYEWREAVDMIHPLIAERPPSYPPIVVRPIGPRQTIVNNEAGKLKLGQQLLACSQDYGNWLQIAYFHF